jgi:hypothetical protein
MPGEFARQYRLRTTVEDLKSRRKLPFDTVQETQGVHESGSSRVTCSASRHQVKLETMAVVSDSEDKGHGCITRSRQKAKTEGTLLRLYPNQVERLQICEVATDQLLVELRHL